MRSLRVLPTFILYPYEVHDFKCMIELINSFKSTLSTLNSIQSQHRIELNCSELYPS
jgi:hypothetical protein